MLDLIKIPYSGGTVDITWVVIGVLLIAAALYLHWRTEKKDQDEAMVNSERTVPMMDDKRA